MLVTNFTKERSPLIVILSSKVCNTKWQSSLLVILVTKLLIERSPLIVILVTNVTMIKYHLIFFIIIRYSFVNWRDYHVQSGHDQVQFDFRHQFWVYPCQMRHVNVSDVQMTALSIFDQFLIKECRIRSSICKKMVYQCRYWNSKNIMLHMKHHFM